MGCHPEHLTLTGICGSGIKALPPFTDDCCRPRYELAVRCNNADEVRTGPIWFRA